MYNAHFNHVAMQADALIRDRKKRSHERVRHHIPPTATFSAPNPPDCHSTSSYDTPVLTEMLKLQQSMNAKLCSITTSPPALFSSEIAVLFTGSFREILFFFVDLRRNKGFYPAESPCFYVSQQKKKKNARKKLAKTTAFSGHVNQLNVIAQPNTFLLPYISGCV